MSETDVERAVPEGPTTKGFRRALAILVGTTAVAAAVVGWIESEAAGDEEQALSAASRGAVDIFVKLAADGSRVQFRRNAAREAVQLSTEADTIVGGSAAGQRAFEVASVRSSATRSAAVRLLKASIAMSRPVRDESELDAATQEALGTSAFRLQPALEAQNRAVERAAEHGGRQDHATFGLGLIALAGALLGLAGLIGATAAGRLVLVLAAAVLVLSLAWAATPALS